MTSTPAAGAAVPAVVLAVAACALQGIPAATAPSRAHPIGPWGTDVLPPVPTWTMTPGYGLALAVVVLCGAVVGWVLPRRALQRWVWGRFVAATLLLMGLAGRVLHGILSTADATPHAGTTPGILVAAGVACAVLPCGCLVGRTLTHAEAGSSTPRQPWRRHGQGAAERARPSCRGGGCGWRQCCPAARWHYSA